jgi:hypothetical protein
MQTVEDGGIEIEDQRSDDGEREIEPHRYAISSYGADYPVDGLVKRLREGSIYVPSFQRGFVWDIKDASRFVESLLLGLPVPSIFLSKESDSGKLLVVDGQQRLSSLNYFYDGVWLPTQAVFALRGVDKSFEGKTYRTLRDEDRRRLDDAILHATVFKQDEPTDDESGVYQVFERLNSGGKKLTPHEIRSAVFHSGPMRELLQELNSDRQWREIYGPEDPRMRDQELILRFLAFYYDSKNYKSPLVFFLNRFMKEHKDLQPDLAAEMRERFAGAINEIFIAIGRPAFRPSRALNAAVFDSVMVGVAKRLERHPGIDQQELARAYGELLKNPKFLEACGRGTAGEERVKERLLLANAAFSDVP